MLIVVYKGRGDYLDGFTITRCEKHSHCQVCPPIVALLLRYQGIRDKISLQEVQCVHQVVLTFGTNPANGGFFPPFGGLEPTAFVQACFGMYIIHH